MTFRVRSFDCDEGCRATVPCGPSTCKHAKATLAACIEANQAPTMEQWRAAFAAALARHWDRINNEAPDHG